MNNKVNDIIQELLNKLTRIKDIIGSFIVIEGINNHLYLNAIGNYFRIFYKLDYYIIYTKGVIIVFDHKKLTKEEREYLFFKYGFKLSLPG